MYISSKDIFIRIRHAHFMKRSANVAMIKQTSFTYLIYWIWRYFFWWTLNFKLQENYIVLLKLLWTVHVCVGIHSYDSVWPFSVKTNQNIFLLFVYLCTVVGRDPIIRRERIWGIPIIILSMSHFVHVSSQSMDFHRHM